MNVSTDLLSQFPYIKHGKNVVGDSAFIIKYLEATYGKPPPTSALQPLQPQAQALCTLCNTIAMERLAWYMVYSRFVPDLVGCVFTSFKSHNSTVNLLAPYQMLLCLGAANAGSATVVMMDSWSW